MLTGLAGVRGQVGLLSGGYSSCIEFIEAAPGLGTVLSGVDGWYRPSLRDLLGVQDGSSPDAAQNTTQPIIGFNFYSTNSYDPKIPKICKNKWILYFDYGRGIK